MLKGVGRMLMSKSRSSMLLVAHLFCYSDLKGNQYIYSLFFKQIIKLVKKIYVDYNTEYDRR